MLTIENLAFAYGKRDPFFSGITLELSKGKICGLLGKNGSGKTSLLKLIAGLLFPDKGECRVMGEYPAKRQPSFLSKIYFLPEDIYVPMLTADDYVKLFSPFYPLFDHDVLKKCLIEFDLPQNKLLTSLSHGQKKKFLLSFGLATNCQLLILDEPTNGLDIPSKAQFRRLLASSIMDEKLFILSTHQVHDVENLIDSVVVLDEGKIIFNQSVIDIAKKLAFVQQQIEPDHSTCFYFEKNLSGYTVVTPNNSDQDSHVDLEILFNAILENKTKFKAIFNEVKTI